MNTENGESRRKVPICSFCKSPNTAVFPILKYRPNNLWLFILFDFLTTLLIRGALSVRSSVCHDCGKIKRYKSVKSWIALIIAIIILPLLLWFYYTQLF